MWMRRFAVLMLSAWVGFLVSACTLGIPNVQLTPTLAPTSTATRLTTRLPNPTRTRAPTLTATFTASPSTTMTRTPSITPSPSMTTTRTPSVTPSPSMTATLTATATFKPTVTRLPTLARTQPVTASPTRMNPSATPPPIMTLIPVPQTEVALPTPPPLITLIPVLQLSPPPSATATTLPTVLPTAITPIGVAPIGERSLPTAQPFDFNNAPVVNQTLEPDTPNNLRSTLQPMRGNHVAQNPRNPSQLAIINGDQQLYLRNGAMDSPIIGGPFTEMTYQSNGQQNALVTYVSWSWNDQLAFIVSGKREDFDGVWIRGNAGELRQVVRDCPVADHIGCSRVYTENTTEWVSQEVNWSSNEDQALLLVRGIHPETLETGYLLVNPALDRAEYRPYAYPFTQATWSSDGQRVLFSGREATSGQWVMGWEQVNPPDHQVEIFFSGDASGWVVHSALEQAEGRIIALASQASPYGALYLIDGVGAIRSELIAHGTPDQILWSSTRDQVTFSVGEQVFVIALPSG